MRPVHAFTACLTALALALAMPAAHGEEMERYEGDGFAFDYPASWSVYDVDVAEWDGWKVPVWAFGSDGQNIDSRLYVAEIPHVIGEDERWGDAIYLSRVAANEADFCSSGEIAWGRYACGSYEVTMASHYHIVRGYSHYILMYEWVREYADGSRVETTSARVDVPARDRSLVMYVEAPTERWETLGLTEAARSFVPVSLAPPPEPSMEMIAEGVYNYYDGYGSLVVVGEGGVLVTDPASTPRAEAMAEAIAGVTDMPVRWVALTHEHYDHVGGTRVFGDAEIVCQEVCAGVFALAGLADVPDRVDVEFDDYHAIDVGGKTVELHHIAPADGDATVVVYMPGERILATADLYSPRALTNAAFIVDTNLLGIREILNEVSSWDADIVLNSHYPGTDPRDLHEATAFFNDLHDAVSPRIAAAIESGVPGAEYVERAFLPDDVELPEYASWANYGDLPHYVLRMVDAIIHGD